jgi:phosphoribosylformylglycinamidine synthase
MRDIFIRMMKRLNIASFEFISTQYDHEVQANSVVKPLQGKGRVNGNVSVIRPVLSSQRGVVLSQGLYPSYSDIDPYWMAACSIDTAVRNAVSAGGTLDHLAILDNFCWCDSTNPERLGQLKEAARACYDFAVAYGTPFISGKDSMFNDFRGYDKGFNEITISIPPTLLVSSIGVIEHVGICQTIDFKFSDDLIYIIGLTGDELGGSEYLASMGEKISGKRYIGNDVPHVDAVSFMKSYRAYETAIRQGIIASCISIERGGLGIAIAKSAIAGLLGCSIDLSAVPQENVVRNDTLLFSESQGRLLVTISGKNKKQFEEIFNGLPFGCIGTVSGNGIIDIRGLSGTSIIKTTVPVLMEAYKGLFEGF